MELVVVLAVAGVAVLGNCPLYRRCDLPYSSCAIFVVVTKSFSFLTTVKFYRLALDRQVVVLEYLLVHLVTLAKE